jgi:hypothetical protein
MKLGSWLVDVGRVARFTDAELALLNERDQSPSRPVQFE